MKRLYWGFSNLLERSFDLSVKRPGLTVLLATCFLTACLVMIPRLRSELRIYDVRDPNFPSTLDLQSVKNQFSLGNSVFLVVASKDGRSLTVSELCAVQDWLVLEERRNPELTGIFNPLSLRKPALDGSKMWYKKIAGLDCKNPGAENPLQGLAGSPWIGSLIGYGLNDIAIEFKFRDTPGNSRYGRFNPAPIGDLWTSFQNDFLSKNPQLTAHLGGRSAFQWHYQNLLKGDMWLNLLPLLILVLGYRYFYRTWLSGILMATSLLISIVFLLGAMAVFDAPIDLLTNSLFVMMCVSTIEDLVFVAHAAVRNRSGSIIEFRRLILPAFLTSFTTVIGFASLQISDLGIVRRFGAWGAAAACIEWFVTFFILPSVLLLLRRENTWIGEGGPKWHERVAAFEPKRMWPRLSFVAFAISLAGIASINFNDSPRETFDRSHIYRQTFEYVTASRKWESSLSVLFPDYNDQEKNAGVLRGIEKLANVAHIEDPYRISAYLTDGLPPLTADLVRSQFKITELWQRYVSPSDQMLATVYVKNFDSKEIGGTVDEIRKICGELCKPVGEGVVYAEYTRSIVATLFESLGVTLLIVGLTIWGLARVYGVPNTGVLIYTVFWCPIVAVGVVGLLQLTVNFITCLFAPVFVGIAGDNAIQYILASRKDRLIDGIASRAGATVQMTVLSAATCVAFLGFTLVGMRTLGLLLAGGFLLLLFGDLLLLKGLISRRNTDRS